MRNPQDPKFQHIQDLFTTGMFIGPDRPVGRVTWSKQSINGLNMVKSGLTPLRWINNQNPVETEMFCRTIDITRSIGTDAATCTITVWNFWGTTSEPEGIDTLGRPGYFSPGRGDQIPPMTSVYPGNDPFYEDSGVTYPTDWGYAPNMYRDVFIPNTVIRTYQGYGSDNYDVNGNEIYVHDLDAGYVAPRDDSKLYQTGVWLIDNMTFATDGTISIQCRDLAKLLIEQYIYPPLIPLDRFPLWYSPASAASGVQGFTGKNVATFHSSSVDGTYGKNAAILGHKGTDAFDSTPATYWLSQSYDVGTDSAWIQAKVTGKISQVVLNAYGGNYVCYISVYENGAWVGAGSAGSNDNVGTGGFEYVVVSGDTLWDLAGTYYGNNLLWTVIAAANNNITDPHWIYPGQQIKIPYVAGTSHAGTGPGLIGSLPFVAKATTNSGGAATINLPRSYDATLIRVTMTNLQVVNGATGHRAGMRTMEARAFTAEKNYVASTIGKPSFIQDWSEAIKEMCGWAGFAWPNVPEPNVADPYFGNDVLNRPTRIWGDFEFLGAGPVVATPGDYFMSKSFMDGIRQIVDFIGGIFYIDETGGCQFRLPNIWSGGNFLNDTTAASSLGARFNQHPIEFHEDAGLIEYEMTIDDQAVRSEILVVGGYPSVTSTGPVAGGYVLGYNSTTNQTSAIDFTDVLAGQYRLMVVPGDSTNLFYTEAECQRMAELTALFILFTYRTGSLKAPCHPALQLDDQVRIFERTTYETNIHYVSGITTHQDVESGEYTMQVTTNWLGKDPDTEWFVDKAQLTPAVTQLDAILARVDQQPGGDIFEQPPYGVTVN